MAQSVLHHTERRSRRANVLLRATLEVAGGSLPVVLRNLSQEGALVQADELPGQGSRVLFHRDGLSVPSTIAWSHCGCAGIEFDFPLYSEEMRRHVPAVEPKPPVPVVRRPGFSSRPLSQAECALIEEWATHPSNRLGE